MNVWTFLGRLGRPAELRRTQNGTAVLNFACAVDSGYGDRKTTTWVDCSLFGKRAESLEQYMGKGQQVVVSGEARLETFTKRDGTDGSKVAVDVNEVTLVGGAPKRQEETPAAAGDEIDF